tara:strand:+ start:852 stop:1226 length:375 start_codon:yes stop_codon:yes gene_type:complete
MDTEVFQRQAFKTGDFIFKDGDEGRMAYIVQKGEIEIVKEVNNSEKILGRITEGGMFGEMALIDSKPRMASARASSSTTVICVNQQMFENKMNDADPFIRGLLTMFAGSIRELTDNFIREISDQ